MEAHQPSILTIQDIDNFLKILEEEPRKCACGRGRGRYEVTSRMNMEVCFGCGKEFFLLLTPMRCEQCVKNGVKVATSPVRSAYLGLTESKEQEKNQNNN